MLEQLPFRVTDSEQLQGMGRAAGKGMYTMIVMMIVMMTMLMMMIVIVMTIHTPSLTHSLTNLHSYTHSYSHLLNHPGKGCLGKSVLAKIQEIITTAGLSKLSGYYCSKRDNDQLANSLTH